MDPMDSYNAGYAARLQQALQGSAIAQGTGDQSQNLPTDDNSAPSDLGPDNYRNNALPPAQQTGAPPVAPQPAPPPGAGAAPPPPGGGGGAPGPAPAAGGAPAAGAAPPPAGGSGSALAPGGAAPAAGDGKSALSDSTGQPGADGKKQLSFRDAWQSQTKAQREKQLDNFEAQLKKGDQTISSAYDQMMQKMGTRPQTGLSKSDKGMLLMEFGMNMMRNSASPQQGGYGRNFGAAAGAAGATSMQSAQQLMAAKRQQAQNWDVNQRQLGIAEGKEKANFAERSMLEEGRDQRAQQTVDSRQAVVGQQQEGANTRSDARIGAQDQRTAATIKAQNDRFFAGQAGQNSRAAAAQAGANDRNNATIANRSALASTGGSKAAAMKSAYDLYLQVHGNDANGNPLPEEQMGQVRQDALDFAANPSKSKMSDGQLLDLATKDANRQYAPNSIQTMGMSENEVEAAKQAYTQKSFQKLKGTLYGGGSGSALAPGAGGGRPRPQSALAPNAPRGTPSAAPAGGAPTSRSDGKVAPPQALDTLRSDPATAAAFLKRYQYLPQEFQKYLGPQSSARSSALQ